MRMLKAALPAVILLSSVAVHAQTVQATLNYPLGVTGVAVNYITNRAFVLLPNFDPNNGSNAVQVLDGSNNSVVATYDVPVSSAIAVNVVSGLVYVGGSVPSTTNPSGVQNEVVAISPWNGKIVATIPISANNGSGIVALAVDPLHDEIFVSNDTDNNIAVINGRSNKVASTLNINGQVPAGLAVNFVSGTLYAALNDNQVAIYSEKTGSLTYATYGSSTSGIAVDPVLSREYVTDAVFTSPTVGVLSGKGATLASIGVGLFPQGVDVDFVTGNVFVANEADGTISKISAYSDSVESTTTVPANSVAVNPREDRLYAVGSTTVTILTEN